MFHKSNFPNANFSRVEDANGYVAEEGDKVEEFDWSHLDADDEAHLAANWHEHLMTCDQITQEAEAELKAWRKANI